MEERAASQEDDAFCAAKAIVPRGIADDGSGGALELHATATRRLEEEADLALTDSKALLERRRAARQQHTHSAVWTLDPYDSTYRKVVSSSSSSGSSNGSRDPDKSGGKQLAALPGSSGAVAERRLGYGLVKSTGPTTNFVGNAMTQGAVRHVQAALRIDAAGQQQPAMEPPNLLSVVPVAAAAAARPGPVKAIERYSWWEDADSVTLSVPLPADLLLQPQPAESAAIIAAGTAAASPGAGNGGGEFGNSAVAPEVVLKATPHSVAVRISAAAPASPPCISNGEGVGSGAGSSDSESGAAPREQQQQQGGAQQPTYALRVAPLAREIVPGSATWRLRQLRAGPTQPLAMTHSSHAALLPASPTAAMGADLAASSSALLPPQQQVGDSDSSSSKNDTGVELLVRLPKQECAVTWGRLRAKTRRSGGASSAAGGGGGRSNGSGGGGDCRLSAKGEQRLAELRMALRAQRDGAVACT